MENRRVLQKRPNYLISISAIELKQIVDTMVAVSINEYLQRNTDAEHQYLTRSETCKILNISLPTLHKWSKENILQSHKINSRVRYIKSEVQKVIKES